MKKYSYNVIVLITLIGTLNQSCTAMEPGSRKKKGLDQQARSKSGKRLLEQAQQQHARRNRSELRTPPSSPQQSQSSQQPQEQSKPKE